MVMASRLLRLPGSEIESVIARELADNPALEARERRVTTSLTSLTSLSSRSTWDAQPSRPWDWGEADDEIDAAERTPARETAIDQLIAQARLTAKGSDLDVAVYLLHSLDEHGFLTADLDELASALRCLREQIERARQVLLTLHPPGIGARDARECLLVQCAHLRTVNTEREDCEMARRMLECAWDDFLHQRWEKIARALRVSADDIENARRFVRENLHPYPLHMMQEATDDAHALTHADLIVRREPGANGAGFVVDIPAAERYELRLSRQFERAWRNSRGEDEAGSQQRDWLDQSVERARVFIDALSHRWDTLRRIGEYLVEYQDDFFERGPRYLKPLTRAVLATALGLHESTVSRAVSDKTIQLPNGRLIPLSDLFDASLAPKEAIRQILADANRMLSDREIAACLRDQGLYLARRTVAKYRQQLGLSRRR
jgi:RNA polymerase sigma-54 factor